MADYGAYPHECCSTERTHDIQNLSRMKFSAKALYPFLGDHFHFGAWSIVGILDIMQGASCQLGDKSGKRPRSGSIQNRIRRVFLIKANSIHLSVTFADVDPIRFGP